MREGSSAEVEAYLKGLTDAELAEVAYRNDQPIAIKARGETARRASVQAASIVNWGKAGVIGGIAGTVISLIALGVSIYALK